MYICELAKRVAGDLVLCRSKLQNHVRVAIYIHVHFCSPKGALKGQTSIQAFMNDNLTSAVQTHTCTVAKFVI